MSKKYFFFDIDGTLTDNKTHQIVPSAKKALELLQKEGHFVAIATGRAHYKAVRFTNPLGIKNLVCCGGGGLVLDGKLLQNEPLEHTKAISLLQEADKHGLGYLLMLDDSDACYMKDYRFLERVGLRKELTTYHYEPNLNSNELKEILKIYLPIRKGEEELYPWMHQLSYLRLTPNYVVYQYDAKKDGILKMMELIQGDIKDVVVFGDDVNDLVMFDKRWFSIAMGNASEELKKHADYVTDRNVEDGIWNACMKFGWIK